MPSPEVTIAQALCRPSSSRTSWPCPICMDAARRVVANWAAIQTAMTPSRQDRPGENPCCGAPEHQPPVDLIGRGHPSWRDNGYGPQS